MFLYSTDPSYLCSYLMSLSVTPVTTVSKIFHSKYFVNKNCFLKNKHTHTHILKNLCQVKQNITNTSPNPNLTFCFPKCAGLSLKAEWEILSFCYLLPLPDLLILFQFATECLRYKRGWNISWLFYFLFGTPHLSKLSQIWKSCKDKRKIKLGIVVTL